MCLVALEHCGRRRKLSTLLALDSMQHPWVSHSRGCSNARQIFSSIPGTSSIEHLRENVTGAALKLPDGALAELNSVAGPGVTRRSGSWTPYATPGRALRPVGLFARLENRV